MTAALEGGEWSAARPGRTLPPGKTRYPFYRRLRGPQGRSRRAENLVPAGIRSQTVQPVVNRYTDWATRPTLCVISRKKLIFNSRALISASLLWVSLLRCGVKRPVKFFFSFKYLFTQFVTKDPQPLFCPYRQTVDLTLVFNKQKYRLFKFIHLVSNWVIWRSDWLSDITRF